jgi:hypothetical protein
MGQTKIIKQRFTLSPFSSEQMKELGDTVLLSVKARMHKGLTVENTPATPLKPTVHVDKSGKLADLIPYPEQKRRKGLQPIRDLFFTGGLTASIQTISANENRAILASNNMVKDMILRKNQKRSVEFGMATTDTEVMQQKVAELLKLNIKVVSSGSA